MEGFNLVLLTTRLILNDYLIQFAGFFVATTAALIVEGPQGRAIRARGYSRKLGDPVIQNAPSIPRKTTTAQNKSRSQKRRDSGDGGAIISGD
jgi:hypothetical protein